MRKEPNLETSRVLMNESQTKGKVSSGREPDGFKQIKNNVIQEKAKKHPE